MLEANDHHTSEQLGELKAAISFLRQLRDDDAQERSNITATLNRVQEQISVLAKKVEDVLSRKSKCCGNIEERVESLEDWRTEVVTSLKLGRWLFGMICTGLGAIASMAVQYVLR